MPAPAQRPRVRPVPVRWPERDASKHTLDHFERFFATLRLPDGAGRGRLHDPQLAKLEDYFDAWEPDATGVLVCTRPGVIENLHLEPTGAGKSTLLAGVGLHHATYVRPDPRVYVIGGLGEQAKNTMEAADGFITRSDDLSRWWKNTKYGMGQILSQHPEDTDGAGIIASSAGRRVGGRGGAQQEGKGPTLILVEELHRHEDNGAAVATMVSKMQKRSASGRQVQIVYATTAGDTLHSPLGRLIERATDVDSGADVVTTQAVADVSRVTVGRVDPDLRPGEYYRRAIDADGDLVMHEWALPEHVQMPPKDAPRSDVDRYLEHVKRANPMPMVTIRSLRLTLRALSATPWVFLRQNANQWVTQDHAAIDRYSWNQRDRGPLWAERERAAGERHVTAVEIPAGVPGVFVGLDTAGRWDRTAIEPAWIDPDTNKTILAGGVILGSTFPGAQRRARHVIDVLLSMLERWPGMSIAFDRNYGGGLIAEGFEEDHGLTVIDFSQSGAQMDLASMLFAELVDQGDIEHDGQPDLTAHVLAAVMRRSRYGKRWRFDQPRSGEPIDAVVAGAMAVWTAHHPPEPARAPIDVSKYRIEPL